MKILPCPSGAEQVGSGKATHPSSTGAPDRQLGQHRAEAAVPVHRQGGL